MKKVSASLFLAFLCVFFTLTLALGTLVFPAGGKTASMRTVLLNPKYREQAALVHLESAGNNLVLRKSGDYWTAVDSASGTVFPADTAAVESLLDGLCAQVSLYEASRSPSAHEQYGLGKTALRVRISGSDGSSFSDLFFGSENFSAREIFMRAANKSAVYRMNNSLYRFLTVKAENWADMKLFASVLGFSTQNMLNVSVEADAYARAYANTVAQATAFDAYARLLLGLRGSSVIHFEPSAPPVAVIRIAADSDKTGIVRVYANGETFAAVPELLDYALEISRWTFDRLLNRQ